MLTLTKGQSTIGPKIFGLFLAVWVYKFSRSVV